MPTFAQKPDADEIAEFITNLKSQKWLGTYSWWPGFVFHFTSITNALNVLKLDRLFSRTQMQARGIQFWDGASSELIDRASQKHQNCVRLFFRPRTPTQHNNEGIRIPGDIQRNAHIPVPVFLLFDSIGILTRSNCVFSDQSITKNMFDSDQDVSFLRSMNFRDIYHEGPIRERKDEIKARRQAEILIPEELDLTSLQIIYCRSSAEKDTFLYLLPDHLRSKWQDLVYSDTKGSLFFKEWTFVDNVYLGKKNIQVRFSPDTKSPGPYTAQFILKDFVSKETIPFTVPDFWANEIRSFRFKKPREAYEFSILLDGHLAYKNQFEDYDIPF